MSESIDAISVKVIFGKGQTRAVVRHYYTIDGKLFKAALDKGGAWRVIGEGVVYPDECLLPAAITEMDERDGSTIHLRP